MVESSRRWSEADSQDYRNLARYAVPERERQIAIITRLVEAANVPGDVLDLCCGEGFLTHAIMAALPTTRLLAYDGSEAMLAETRKGAPDPDRVTVKLIDLARSDWRTFSPPLRAAVSSLAIHHLDGREKRQLFADLHAAIAPGGVFVLADLVEPAQTIGTRISADLWDEETRRRALDADGEATGFEIFERAEWNYFRYGDDSGMDRPSTLTDHLDWLREAGFDGVDVHWLVAGHAIISAWRKKA